MTSVADSCVVVLLTFNSAGIIRETLTQALKVSSSVYIVDSGSQDGTVDIARALGCEVVQRAFTNYSDQRNWAISQLQSRYGWQLHLDADEVLDEVAVSAINNVLVTKPHNRAFMLRRRDYFMGRMLRFSGVNPWHMRLFKSGLGQCENRMYDQHFVARCAVDKLPGLMHDKNSSTLSDWIARHNRWSDLEAEQMATKMRPGDDVLQSRLFGDPRERTRALKTLYYKLPTGLRAVLYFMYRYFIRLGILDGRPGFYFAFLQALWFRLLVDAKTYERRMATDDSRVPS